jgi:hypothetical protein
LRPFDFFTVDVLTLAGLARHFVLFVIDIETRRVQPRGSSANLTALG